MDKLEQWICEVGGQAEAAKRLGVSRQAVHNWMRVGQRPSVEMAKRIELASEGKVSAVEIIFGSAA